MDSLVLPTQVAQYSPSERPVVPLRRVPPVQTTQTDLLEADAQPRRSTKRVSRLGCARLRAAKRSYVTRNVDLELAQFLKKGDVQPEAGDLVLARVLHLGQHQRIEGVGGRRAWLHVGDEVVLSYGARYAADQFEGHVPKDLASCYMVAAGGIAATFESKNSRMKNPTKIKPLGLLCNAKHETINLRDFAGTPKGLQTPKLRPHVIAVVGSGMNSGKTTVAAKIIRALSLENLRVAALKITGTGAGGDMWQYQDAGACAAYDFTDAGYASTFQVADAELHGIATRLLRCAVERQPDVIVVEVADGLLQKETHHVIRSDWFRDAIDTLVFAARDGLSASAGVELIRKYGLPLRALSGMLTSAPLCSEEARLITGVPILDAVAFDNTVELAHVLLRHD